jgi:hypothetical protein
MEPQKRARYSKFLDADELEEIMMEEESDEELYICLHHISVAENKVADKRFESTTAK